MKYLCVASSLPIVLEHSVDPLALPCYRPPHRHRCFDWLSLMSMLSLLFFACFFDLTETSFAFLGVKGYAHRKHYCSPHYKLESCILSYTYHNCILSISQCKDTLLWTMNFTFGVTECLFNVSLHLIPYDISIDMQKY